MSKVPETLTIEESECLLVYVAGIYNSKFSLWKNHRNLTMTLLMLDAGLRVGEVVRTRPHDLWLGSEPARALNVSTGIAEKGCNRIVPLSSRLRESIKNMQQIIWSVIDPQTNAYAFFVDDVGKAITPRQIQRLIETASLLSIGRKIHPHILRHTFATRLMRLTSTPVVQQLLGHKRLTSTQVYVHPNGDDCQKAIDLLDSL